MLLLVNNDENCWFSWMCQNILEHLCLHGHGAIPWKLHTKTINCGPPRYLRRRYIVQELKTILSLSCYSVNSRWTKNCLYLFGYSSFSSRSETGMYCYRQNIEEHLSRRKCRDNSTEIVIFYRDRSLIDDW